jgi:hypothetical protein
MFWCQEDSKEAQCKTALPVDLYHGNRCLQKWLGDFKNVYLIKWLEGKDGEQAGNVGIEQ